MRGLHLATSAFATSSPSPLLPPVTSANLALISCCGESVGKDKKERTGQHTVVCGGGNCGRGMCSCVVAAGGTWSSERVQLKQHTLHLLLSLRVCVLPDCLRDVALLGGLACSGSKHRQQREKIDLGSEFLQCKEQSQWGLASVGW